MLSNSLCLGGPKAFLFYILGTLAKSPKSQSLSPPHHHTIQNERKACIRRSWSILWLLLAEGLQSYRGIPARG